MEDPWEHSPESDTELDREGTQGEGQRAATHALTVFPLVSVNPRALLLRGRYGPERASQRNRSCPSHRTRCRQSAAQSSSHRAGASLRPPNGTEGRGPERLWPQGELLSCPWSCVPASEGKAPDHRGERQKVASAEGEDPEALRASGGSRAGAGPSPPDPSAGPAKSGRGHGAPGLHLLHQTRCLSKSHLKRNFP